MGKIRLNKSFQGTGEHTRFLDVILTAYHASSWLLMPRPAPELNHYVF
jgi:hypothetical protein